MKSGSRLLDLLWVTFVIIRFSPRRPTTLGVLNQQEGMLAPRVTHNGIAMLAIRVFLASSQYGIEDIRIYFQMNGHLLSGAWFGTCRSLLDGSR